MVALVGTCWANGVWADTVWASGVWAGSGAVATSSTAAASTLRTRKQPKTKAERGEEWRRTMRNMQEYERSTAPKPADPVQAILAEPVPTPRIVRGPVPLDPRDA